MSAQVNVLLWWNAGYIKEWWHLVPYCNDKLSVGDGRLRFKYAISPLQYRFPELAKMGQGTMTFFCRFMFIYGVLTFEIFHVLDYHFRIQWLKVSGPENHL